MKPAAKIMLYFQEAFNRYPFAFFLSVSVAIHLTLLISVPISFEIRPHVQPEFFEVNLVPPLPLNPKELYPQKTFKKPVTPQKWSKLIKKTGKTFKKNLKPEIPSVQPEKEATVSLYADNKKHSKYSSYLSHLRYKIDSTWEYPSYAKERGIEGELTLCFSIGKNGRLTSIKLLEPSGHLTLDQEAILAIRDSAPFNPFPDSFIISTLNVLASFKYQFSAK